MSRETQLPALTGDRVLDARVRHRRERSTSSHRCAECLQPWPCLTAALLEELDLAEKANQRLRQKSVLVKVGRERPRLPSSRKAGGRFWKTTDICAQLSWAREQTKALAELGEAVMRRAVEDADSAQQSTPIEGARATTYNLDGSKTGRVPSAVLARETKITDPTSGKQAWSWQVDPIAKDLHDFTEAVEGIGDDLAGALSAAHRLLGLSHEDAKALVEPRIGRCENDACRKLCEGTVGDRLIIEPQDGMLRCEPCYRYKRRTGRERPSELCRESVSMTT